MDMEVIGAGHGRTGTRSLKEALEILGFGPCHHMEDLLAHPERARDWQRATAGQPVDWDALLAGYRSTVDFPAYRLYRPLMERYPKAKVVLTVRDPESWYESADATIYRAGPSPLQKALMSLQMPFSRRLRDLVRVFRLADRSVWAGDFGGRFEDKVYALDVFKRHNEEVKRTVPPERLLVYEATEGWGPLCDFLGVPVPDHAFPHLNERASFGRGKGAAAR